MIMISMGPLAHINVYFELDGKKYEVENFHAGFSQPVDYKGQPQRELTNDILSITLSHIADENLYQWAKTPTSMKGGTVLFQTDLGITILRIIFTNAYCIGLAREIDATKGSSTTLSISPEQLILNGIEHNNFWPEK